MPTFKGPAWKYFESLRYIGKYEGAKCRFCGKKYNVGKEPRLAVHLLKQCQSATANSRAEVEQSEPAAALLSGAIDVEEEEYDSSDDESGLEDDEGNDSDEEEEAMSVEEQEARKCGEISYCLPAFPNVNVADINEEDEVSVLDRTLTEEDILREDVDMDDEGKILGKPRIEAIEQSRYQDFIAKHRTCARECHAVLTQEQLMGRRKSVRALGYHARSVFLVSQVLTTFPLDGHHNARFFFAADRRICRDAFVYANDITRSRLYRARKLVWNGSFGNLTHGLAGVKGTSALKRPQIEGALRFLAQYGSLHELLVPTVQGTSTGLPNVYLPTKLTKVELWEKYEVSQIMSKEAYFQNAGFR
ncbi:hypothetical protein RvY_02331 [Ramazzottius varieornatus]|uniref:BED-type domain-containing protein n=1 Tax=Ramazzottius varieornatus TaxID=947166 RepID=A0A1D1URE7_RAMVA|nr:hypothetical protein RvY_02331 [Ramazzottius varieornatus]